MALPPLKQGALDSLCGLYAVMNAARQLITEPVAAALPQDVLGAFENELFIAVAKALPAKAYPKVLWDGTTPAHMAKMARAAAAHLKAALDIDVAVERPFARRNFRGPTEFAEELKALTASSPRSFILWIDWATKNGGYAHWTVYRRLHGGNLHLFDGGDRRISLRKLRINGDRGDRLTTHRTVSFRLIGMHGERWFE